MDKEIIPTEQAQIALEKVSTPNLCAAIQGRDKMQMNVVLRQFKTDTGAVNYPAVLSIPVENRLPEMVKNDLYGTLGMINVALTLAFESMNLKRGMTDVQIVDLAEAIVDTVSEDYLALEDLMLFLQKLVRGEYGVMYESIDIPKFMTSFDMYRDERHKQLIIIRENTHLEHKAMGDGTRSSKKDALDEHFYSMADRLSAINRELKATRKENKELKGK